jgi:hypothetical protein
LDYLPKPLSTATEIINVQILHKFQQKFIQKMKRIFNTSKAFHGSKRTHCEDTEIQAVVFVKENYCTQEFYLHK